MQSCHVFVMSLKSSSKTSDNSEVQKGKIGRMIHFVNKQKYITLKSLLIIIWIYFFQWKEILQKRVTLVIRVCYINMKAKCDMLRQKNGRGLASIFFFFARCEEFSIFFSTLVFGVLHVWHEGELGNLIRQINERHMCVELFFFHARNPSLSSLFSSTK